MKRKLLAIALLSCAMNANADYSVKIFLDIMNKKAENCTIDPQNQIYAVKLKSDIPAQNLFAGDILIMYKGNTHTYSPNNGLDLPSYLKIGNQVPVPEVFAAGPEIDYFNFYTVCDSTVVSTPVEEAPAEEYLTVTPLSSSPYYYSSPNVFRIENVDNSEESYNYLRITVRLVNKENGEVLDEIYPEVILDKSFSMNLDLHTFYVYGPEFDFSSIPYLDVSANFELLYYDYNDNVVNSKTKTSTQEFRIYPPEWTLPEPVTLSMSINGEKLTSYGQYSFGYTEDTAVYSTNYGSATGNNFTYRGKNFKLDTLVFDDFRVEGGVCAVKATVRASSGRDAYMLFETNSDSNPAHLEIGPYSYVMYSNMYTRPQSDYGTQYSVGYGSPYNANSTICDILDYFKSNPSTIVKFIINN